MKRLYQNWTVHNLIGHPLMQIFELLGMSKIATRVHDETLPSNAKVTGSPALSASPSGLPGYATEVEK